MNHNIVFDSFALLAYFRMEKGHEQVTDLLTDIAIGEKDGFICLVNVGEIYYITARKQNDKRAQLAIDSVKQLPIQIETPDFSQGLSAK